MSDQTKNPKQKKPKSLDEEIAAAQDRLNRLVAQKREAERKALERNQKAIAALLRSEKFDAVPIEEWTAALPSLRKLLKIGAPLSHELRKVERPQSGAGAVESNGALAQDAA